MPGCQSDYNSVRCMNSDVFLQSLKFTYQQHNIVLSICRIIYLYCSLENVAIKVLDDCGTAGISKMSKG
ncbi:hypothetical protein PV328_003585 [Microctonus aethiopoides]|uniref:Uncharacterized protein n=1 Tax=Microctonus aethiopoides TaxID=144406 RepID=A0AA39F8V3_9HYME|nr:hypothetical protein PV328_003585 [Microctonus aethiopoides]